ncbi:hypothetical protein K0M31_003812 [Melipona bicolor]|uniref:Uncharacterized protein n=1 Tax=Melipona bicolor TaxID=60889 RepID=A0AA40FXL7_9HYME|nr:hypothetical protein K0M31_003812 [Melipona bicolor]
MRGTISGLRAAKFDGDTDRSRVEKSRDEGAKETTKESGKESSISEQSELSGVVIHLSRLGWPESLNALPATGILA